MKQNKTKLNKMKQNCGDELNKVRQKLYGGNGIVKECFGI